MSEVNQQPKSVKPKMPKIRFERFREDWSKTIFSDCFDIKNGYAYKSSNFIEEYTGKIVLTPGSIALGGGYQPDKGRNYKLGAEIPEGFVFQAEDMFVTLTDLTPSAQALGYPAIVPTDENLYLHNQRLGKLTHLKLDMKFLYHLLRTNRYHKYIVSTASGTTVKHSSASIVLDYETFVPEQKEQIQIGNFFQELDKLIELQTRAIESAEMYKKAMLQKMFPQKGEKAPKVRFEKFDGNWNENKIGNITSSYSGGTPSVSESAYYHGDIPFIRSGEIRSNNTELYITELGLINSSAKMVEQGDILYALYGATSGEVSRSKIKGAINQAILAIKPKDMFCSEYLNQLLGSMKEEIIKKYLQGGQGNLSGSIIKDLKVLVPSLEEQTKIGNYFQELDRNIETEKKKLEQYQTMKRAMLQRMFV